jgi:3-methyladenine DNA glycosylase/8-oxoguanine DNA glycosylase
MIAVEQPDIEALLSRADPALGRVIEAVCAKIGRQRIMSSRASPFEALTRAIVYQSVSGNAAAAIFARLKIVAGTLTPGRVTALTPAAIVSAGLSKSKTQAILSLAEWFSANRRAAKALPMLSDEEVIAALTDIPGIGLWTANVFLIFNLGRLDVMPATDLGIRRGVRLVYGLKGVATARQVHDKALLWRPYRSIASIYLWNAVKLKVSAADLT